MSAHYIRCSRCEAGIDMDTGESCERCNGHGGVWVVISSDGGLAIEVRNERPPEPSEGDGE